MLKFFSILISYALLFFLSCAPDRTEQLESIIQKTEEKLRAHAQIEKTTKESLINTQAKLRAAQDELTNTKIQTAAQINTAQLAQNAAQQMAQQHQHSLQQAQQQAIQDAATIAAARQKAQQDYHALLMAQQALAATQKKDQQAIQEAHLELKNIQEQLKIENQLLGQAEKNLKEAKNLALVHAQQNKADLLVEKQRTMEAQQELQQTHDALKQTQEKLKLNEKDLKILNDEVENLKLAATSSKKIFDAEIEELRHILAELQKEKDRLSDEINKNLKTQDPLQI
jgi:hypothetical protein